MLYGRPKGASHLREDRIVREVWGRRVNRRLPTSLVNLTRRLERTTHRHPTVHHTVLGRVVVRISCRILQNDMDYSSTVRIVVALQQSPC